MAFGRVASKMRPRMQHHPCRLSFCWALIVKDSGLSPHVAYTLLIINERGYEDSHEKHTARDGMIPGCCFKTLVQQLFKSSSRHLCSLQGQIRISRWFPCLAACAYDRLVRFYASFSTKHSSIARDPAEQTCFLLCQNKPDKTQGTRIISSRQHRATPLG